MSVHTQICQRGPCRNHALEECHQKGKYKASTSVHLFVKTKMHIKETASNMPASGSIALHEVNGSFDCGKSNRTDFNYKEGGAIRFSGE